MAKKSSKTTRDSKQEDTSIVEGWIPKENVATFSEYKYKSPHKTYLEGVVLEIFWEWLSQFIPRFIAPNLITTIGLLVIFVGMIPLIMEDPSISNQVSSWIYVYIAISIWIYQLLDALDGKQARRTKTSSVLGELFDHGGDAITGAIMTLIYCCIFSYGSSYGSGVAIVFQLGIFVLFTFEKRFTYELRTAVGEFGTIETHYLYMLFLLLRAYIGPEIVFYKIDYLSNMIGYDFNLRNAAIVIGLFTTFNAIGLTFYTALNKANNSKDKSYCLQYMAYITICFTLALAVLPFLNTFSAYPVPCLLLFYCAMIKIGWKFIITSVLKFHFNIYTWDQLLPIIGTLGIFAIEKVIDSNKGLSSTLSILILLITVVASVVHLSLFAYGTVYQIAAHLKINVFTIKPKD